jgi:hypothetical protein
MSDRYAIRDYILTLNPENDHQEIVYLISAYEFPYLSRKSLEFALFRTYAVPSISGLLASTGQFDGYGQRRYDDTALILAEITENGYDSERGRAALRRMNRMHGRFDISNDDYLYVLSTFIYEPIRWNQRFAWRKSTEIERQASYVFWREVGRRMNIKDIPASYEAFEQFNIAYERDHFRFTGTNYQVGEATVQIFLKWYAPPLRPMVREVIYALLDDPLREAFGFPKASSALTRMVTLGLKARAFAIRRLASPRTTPWLFTREPNRTYPMGYTIEHLGPINMPVDRVVKRD